MLCRRRFLDRRAQILSVLKFIVRQFLRDILDPLERTASS